MIASLATMLVGVAAPAVDAQAADRIVRRAGFHGVALIGDGDRIAWSASTLPGGAGLTTRWRWASVTKQIAAVIAMQEVSAGRLDLEAPIARYWPDWPGAGRETITIAMLLRHRSGLANPEDDTPDGTGTPAFYRPTGDAGDPRRTATGYCAKSASAPGGDFRYNNCDFIVLGGVLERVTGKDFATLLRERIALPLDMRSLGYAAPGEAPAATRPGHDAKGGPESVPPLYVYGAAGAVHGAPTDLWRLDRALMGHRLLDDAAKAKLWEGDPRQGYSALGQWSFSVRLKGCAAPVAIVERRGQIGGVEIRNLLLPTLGRATILFSDRAGFDFGELWQAKGFSYDLLSLTACGSAS